MLSIRVLALDVAMRHMGWVVAQVDEVDDPAREEDEQGRLEQGRLVASLLAAGTIHTEMGKPLHGIKTRKTRKTDARFKCARELSVALGDLVQEWTPGMIVTEMPTGAKNAATTLDMGTACGLVIGLVTAHDLHWEFYTPHDCKKACGVGDAADTKKAVQAVIRNTWPDFVWPTKDKDYQHAMDAASAIVAALADGSFWDYGEG